MKKALKAHGINTGYSWIDTHNLSKFPLLKDGTKCQIIAYTDDLVLKVMKTEKYKDNRYMNELWIANEIIKRGVKPEAIKGLAQFKKIKVSKYGEPSIVMRFYDGGSLAH